MTSYTRNQLANPRGTILLESIAEYLSFSPNRIRVCSTGATASHLEITVRSTDQRTAERLIDEAISLSVHKEHQSMVYRGATLSANPTFFIPASDKDKAPEHEYFTYTTIITDRRPAY